MVAVLHVFVDGSIKPPDHERGTMYACCNMYGKDISYKSGNCGLSMHIKSKHPDKGLNFVSIASGGFKRPATDGNVRDRFKNLKAPKLLSKTEKQEHVNRQMARWLAMDVLPFTTVESKPYRQHIESIDSTMKPFLAVTMKDTLRSLEDNIQDAIVKSVAGSWMSLTMDHWTLRGKDSYTGMTAHRIDENFDLQNQVLGCWLHEGESELQTLQDNFLEELFKKCKFAKANITGRYDQQHEQVWHVVGKT
jgi:hypothetical protein